MTVKQQQQQQQRRQQQQQHQQDVVTLLKLLKSVNVEQSIRPKKLYFFKHLFLVYLNSRLYIP
jgi:hypothetical protein